MNQMLGIAAFIRAYGRKVGGYYEVFIPDTVFQSIPQTATLEEEKTPEGVRVKLHLNPTIDAEEPFNISEPMKELEPGDGEKTEEAPQTEP